MKYQFKSYSRVNKNKTMFIYWIVVSVVIWIAFMCWSLILGHRTVMFEWFSKWTISITFAAIVSVIGGVLSILRRPLKYTFKNFLQSGFMTLVLLMPAFDVWAYLLTTKTICYQTEYEITSSGPSTS